MPDGVCWHGLAIERSIELLEEEGDQYGQANDETDECFPVLEHDSLLGNESFS